jgi:thiamine biosynthesis lipoprotein
MKRVLIFSLIVASCVSCKKQEPKNTKVAGLVFGTTYSVIYDTNENYEKEFDSLFYVINKSMSTYISNSDISKLNRNEVTTVDVHFTNVFEASKEIYRQTEGAFDPTIGAVVNAWSFGPEGAIENLDSLKVKALMASVGLNRVGLRDNSLVKQHLDTRLDFNAVAKGYAVDVVAEFLETQDVENYLVEIGGELRAKGLNIEKESAWTVGLDEPRFDGNQSVLKAITIQDAAMATSGTYRKFKIDENGNRFAHIIDTKTGYPSKTNILSVSVMAKECMTADAYATAFQAMGVESVTSFLKLHPELKVFIVFENENQEFETLSLNNFPTN